MGENWEVKGNSCSAVISKLESNSKEQSTCQGIQMEAGRFSFLVHKEMSIAVRAPAVTRKSSFVTITYGDCSKILPLHFSVGLEWLGSQMCFPSFAIRALF